MRNLVTYLFLSFCYFGFAQNTVTDLLKTYNSETIPYITVQELAMPKTDAIILDARETEEYNVSHIESAIHVGSKDFNIQDLKDKLSDTTKPIVVYCSVGIRSEDIAEKIKKAGYANVYNLFGGIFEWKNNGFPVFNNDGNETENVHVYSKSWSKWLKKGTKIYD